MTFGTSHCGISQTMLWRDIDSLINPTFDIAALGDGDSSNCNSDQDDEDEEEIEDLTDAVNGL